VKLLGSTLVGIATLAILAPPASSAVAKSSRRMAPRAATTPPPARQAVLPFIADDYARAVAEAKARKVPIFIEAWAPW
jgi:hypothetical protein